MKVPVTLKRRSRIWHEPGETVDVSPEEARHLCAIGSAVPARPSAGKKPAPKKEKNA